MSAGPIERAALWYAQELGWPVFPLRERDKIPQISQKEGGHGFKDATTHAEQITEWWSRWPHCNIGLATGYPFVLDVDGPDGEKALRDHFAALPATVEVTTSRGRHLYFAPPDGFTHSTSSGKLGPKLDTRAVGGYVVAWPSIHPSGHVYTWAPECSPDEIELAPMPADIIRALTSTATVPALREKPSARAPGSGAHRVTLPHASASLQQFRAWLAKVNTGLAEGQSGGRKLTAYRIARRALEVLPLVDVLHIVHAWNAGNHPPLAECEVERKVHDAAGVRRGRAA